MTTHDAEQQGAIDRIAKMRGIVIVASEERLEDDTLETLLDHLCAMSFNHKDCETLLDDPDIQSVRAEITARLAAHYQSSEGERE